ncbi:immunity protein 7 of polymorphic toxin system [Amycolatopsis sulphurea]|uniref:Immunity protein 7 of polymorphic toxin system n=1 Tax=Amycolatopsis sulphurea TaxID=76022 RepID=A0A2A9FBP7_9PSEU|nr:immunity 7 family protein [Amycolatopsis sulphurea]PFG48191.1 immunity protein 7 of polymorphic toxin system [Amycolatopsis sulphurea]
MFEYHGWVTIAATASGDDDAALLERLVDRVHRTLRDAGTLDLVDLRWSSGLPMLHLGGLDKHGGAISPELLETFARVGELAPGSYGLLHVWDDQDPECDNEFRVFRMARGQVSEQRDPHLTPVAPTVLDSYEL